MFPCGRRGWLGSLQWLHHPPLPRRPLPWPSARHSATRQLSDLSCTVSCLKIRRRLAKLRLRMEVVGPLHPSFWAVVVCGRTVSNRRCARTALEIALPDMICSTALGAYIISNSSLIPEPAIRWPMLPRKLISMWKAPNLSIRLRILVSDYLLAVTVVWLTISTTGAVQYLVASNMHVFRCIYCEDLR